MTVIYLRTRSADPQDPGDNLSFQDGKIQTYNTAIRGVWQLKKKSHEKYNHIHMQIVSWSFLSLIPEEYKHSSTAQQLTTTSKITFLQVFE